MMAAALAKMPFLVIAALAALAGTFASPITTLTRTIWRNLFDDEDDRRTAFALDAVMIEFNFTIGPALVAMMLAFFNPTAPFVLTIFTVGSSAGIDPASGSAQPF